MAQRNVTLQDAGLVITFGTVEYRTGVEFYFLAQRDIPPGREHQLEKLVGTTVVVRSGRTKREVVQRSLDQLRKYGARVLGVVMNRQQYVIPEFIYRRL
jgi:hypothetical protein